MDFTKIARALIAVTAFTAACVLQTGAAAAKWLRAESPNFIVYGEMTEAELRDKTLELERFDQALRAISNVRAPASPRKLEVYLTQTAQFKDVMQRNLEGVLGFYTSSPELSAFVSSRESVKQELGGGGRIKQTYEIFTPQAILQHEYTHHFMFQYFNQSYPAWYREGFAEYVSTMQAEDNRIKVGDAPSGRLLSLDANAWIPAGRFMKLGDQVTVEEVQAVYAQGWLAVHYMNSTTNLARGLGVYLAALNEGADPDQALQQATGMTFSELDKALRDYMNGKVVIRTYEGWKFNPPEVQITAVPEGYGSVLLIDLGSRLGQGEYESRLRSLRRAFQRFSADEGVRLALARALILEEEWAEAQSLLEGVGETPASLILQGQAALAEAGKAEDESAKTAAFAKARKFFARASKVDPESVPALVGYVKALPEREAYSENAINVRLLASEIAPQVDLLSIDAAYALIKVGRSGEALPLLQPVANTAHTGRYTKYAQALLEAAKTGSTPSDYATWAKAKKEEKVKR